MFSKTICIQNLESAKKFIDLTNRYMHVKIHLLLEDYVIDAHSVMGIFSLELNKPVELRAEGDVLSDFILDLEAFSVA